MPDITTSTPAKATASKPVEMRSRQGSGSRMYANVRSATVSLRVHRRYGLQAISGVFSGAMVVMTTYILLHNANTLLHMHLSAREMMVVLASIGGVSFTVGGLMMMKILCVAGRERSREFAIRQVIGARRSDIRNQLLFEVLLLSVAGGVSGSTCGLFIGFVLTLVLQIPYIANPVLLLFLLSSSIVPGIVCGLYSVRWILGLDFAKVLYTSGTG